MFRVLRGSGNVSLVANAARAPSSHFLATTTRTKVLRATPSLSFCDNNNINNNNNNIGGGSLYVPRRFFISPTQRRLKLKKRTAAGGVKKSNSTTKARAAPPSGEEGDALEIGELLRSLEASTAAASPAEAPPAAAAAAAPAGLAQQQQQQQQRQAEAAGSKANKAGAQAEEQDLSQFEYKRRGTSGRGKPLRARGGSRGVAAPSASASASAASDAATHQGTGKGAAVGTAPDQSGASEGLTTTEALASVIDELLISEKQQRAKKRQAKREKAKAKEDPKVLAERARAIELAVQEALLKNSVTGERLTLPLDSAVAATSANAASKVSSSGKSVAAQGGKAAAAAGAVLQESTTAAASLTSEAVPAGVAAGGKKGKKLTKKEKKALKLASKKTSTKPTEAAKTVAVAAAGGAGAPRLSAEEEKDVDAFIVSFIEKRGKHLSPEMKRVLAEQLKKRRTDEILRQQQQGASHHAPPATPTPTARASDDSTGAGAVNGKVMVKPSSAKVKEKAKTFTTSPSNTTTTAVAVAAAGDGSSNSSACGTLLTPDYRENVLAIFQKLADINMALGENYKAKSYTFAIEYFKRHDKLFELLPPNLKPIAKPQMETIITELKSGTTGDAATRFAIKKILTQREDLLVKHLKFNGIGDKLHTKILEILQTGDLKELHQLQSKPIIQAIQNLTEIHGFGPRTALHIYRKFGIRNYEELLAYAKKTGQEFHPHTNSAGGGAGDDDEDLGQILSDLLNSGGGDEAAKKPKKKCKKADEEVLSLTDAQKIGIYYYHDIKERLPYNEGRLHEAFLKHKIRQYYGGHYTLTICGSYRRKTPSSGDMDILITESDAGESVKANNKRAAGKKGKRGRGDGSGEDEEGGEGEGRVPGPSEVIASFVKLLQGEARYMEATLAQGPTKFMGVARLSMSSIRELNNNNNSDSDDSSAHSDYQFKARRIDIRYVDRESYPAALLYFTGSKNFNVLMRQEAIRKGMILNEYGLFRNPVASVGGHHHHHSSGSGGGSNDTALGNKQVHDLITKISRLQFGAPGAAKKKDRNKSDKEREKEREELRELKRRVDALRVKAATEEEVFRVLDMEYVAPENRNV